MTTAVSLNKFIFEMGSLGFVAHVYLSRTTGEFVTVTDDQLMYAEQDNDDDAPEDERESLPRVRAILASDDWIELPSQWDMDESHVMEQFCNAVEDKKLRDELLAAVREGGTFGRVKSLLVKHDLEKPWQAFRENALREVAIEWLRANGVAYQD